MVAGDALSIRRNSVQLFIEYTRDSEMEFSFYSFRCIWLIWWESMQRDEHEGEKSVASENSETIFPCFVWVEINIVCVPQRAASEFPSCRHADAVGFICAFELTASQNHSLPWNQAKIKSYTMRVGCKSSAHEAMRAPRWCIIVRFGSNNSANELHKCAVSVCLLCAPGERGRNQWQRASSEFNVYFSIHAKR